MRHVGLQAVSVLLLFGLLVASCAEPGSRKVMAERDDSDPFASLPPLKAGPQSYMLEPQSNITWTAQTKAGDRWEGGFDTIAGSIEVPRDDPAQAAIAIRMDLGSLYSDAVGTTNAMKSPAFLDVDKYPVVTFASTRIIDLDEVYLISGMLTLHGVSRKVTFPAEVQINGTNLVAQGELVFSCNDYNLEARQKATLGLTGEMRFKVRINAKRTWY
ncbi:MAG: hypothetical protein AMXMBFR84_47740 [Candidatus Hydrogenedentota bacterium]